MKKLSVLVLILMLTAGLLAACGASGSTATGTDSPSEGGSSSGSGAEEEIYIPIISKGFQHQFWQAVKAGAEQAGQELGVRITFEGPETESQVDKQIEMLQAALDKKPSAIGFAALDSQASIPYLKKAQENNIPVIAFDSGVESDIPVTTASTDNMAASALAADKMAKLIGNEGKIAMVVHDQTSVTGVSRRDGFKKQIEDKYPNIEIVDIQYGGGDHLKSTDLAKAMMQAHPDLKGIFGANEGSAVGVINAVTEMKKEGQIVVVGFDSGKAQIDAIKNGTMAGAITQNPVGIGYETVKAAVAAIKGEKVEPQIDTGFYWYDKNNIDSDEIKAVIYE
ncbi:BMP family ABC transporter substrate-binding protein [Paenibacillus glucanolyticus]|jgi:ribose transport system substrate-binding protein|uniref:ABC transporter substrate-binding protein n=1 Tax=Paenibacillus TaxID=44249 RepID=UPI0003E1BD73|nr:MULTISPECIES: ABC transporter substrate-binding protein [Paenibacillus]ANA82877.1 BMP family ABC transporter substrate-binding protein [Paenibacillus glucanolyticus]AVV58036.1 BMP family ABC transporter substrate-binding protein [Paenibacillus glucanolyticus]ETT42776.1 periplasmic-binding protein/LacI transcriptional regulator [Paenibacillus sp. FSL R5-808]MPY17905.1 ABC transporter substrate-binding protein [Paenibacillus glucanolyticus]OMF83505.1 BMP family ABC transporter substrate-bindi